MRIGVSDSRIFGGYRGYFSTIPYYLKVQEYRDIENRDIWGIPPELRRCPQIQRLLMHAWELQGMRHSTIFSSGKLFYHLLSLLEYADPSLHLTDRFLLDHSCRHRSSAGGSTGTGDGHRLSPIA